MPAKRRRVNPKPPPARKPLSTSNLLCDHNQIKTNLIDIFNKAQHVTSSDQALSQLKKLYISSDYSKFEKPFQGCFKRVLQETEQTIYFKTSCEFVCKFIQHVTNLQDDRLLESIIDVTDHYMQIEADSCRHNACYFVCKLLAHVEFLDEDICKAIKLTLLERMRDIKPSIRAQAVVASEAFQDTDDFKKAFSWHATYDPEQTVRKALVHTMRTDRFGHDFLVDFTHDVHETIRRVSFQRLGKVAPKELRQNQLHQIIHNGFSERDRRTSLSFKSNTLEPWLTHLYDGVDLTKLLEPFDVIGHHEDVNRLLEYVYERDLEKPENNGTTTKLHHVVEAFRARWLNNKCRPNIEDINERVITVWLSLVNFCKTNQNMIKPVKIRNIPANADESIEKMLENQEDDVVELYERLTPDLINLVELLNLFVKNTHRVLDRRNTEMIERYEFTYHKLMNFMLTYEIGDELERKTLQENLATILQENLLTERFTNFIQPIIRCYCKLVYSTNPNLIINYISELINNVRSHLEDLVAPSQPSTILAPSRTPRSAKKVRITDHLPTRASPGSADVSDMSLIIDNEPDDNKLSSTMLGPPDICMDETQNSISMDESQASVYNRDDIRLFKNHLGDLIKCLQMYYACLENVKVKEVPPTMLNHLRFLTYECLDEFFQKNSRIRSLMIACNGLTALQDKTYAHSEGTMTLLMAACYDTTSLEIKSTGFKSLVDIMIEHDDGLQVPMDRLKNFLNTSLRDYGKYDPKNMDKTELDFITGIVHGTAKLFYYQKLYSPEILSHLILWWYHPRTHSKLTQFIGVFLPLFVKDVSARQANNLDADADDWLQELLAETYVMSIVYLQGYIRGPGINIMDVSDIHSMISFLGNLVPLSYHPRVADIIDQKIDDASGNTELIRYLKQSRNSLSASPPPKQPRITRNNTEQDPIAVPLQLFD